MLPIEIILLIIEKTQTYHYLESLHWRKSFANSEEIYLILRCQK